MVWYEFFSIILNILLLFINLSLGFYCFFRMNKLSPYFKKHKTVQMHKLFLQGIILIEFYFAIALYVWIIEHLQIKVGLLNYLDMVAGITKSTFFLITLIKAIKWINKKSN